MLKPYQCPYAHRQKRVNFMMCKRLMDYTKHDYTKTEDCASAICAFGYWCPQTGRPEVSSNAKKDCAVRTAEDGGTLDG